MKYIMFLAEARGLQVLIPVIFPKNLVHKFVATCMEPCIKAHGYFTVIPIRAGDVSIFGTDITCSGKSDTLNLKSDPNDASIIHNYDYSHGMNCDFIEEAIKKAKESK